jgi:hypothetical protein
LGQSDQSDQKDQKLQNRIIFKICIFAENLKAVFDPIDRIDPKRNNACNNFKEV